MLINAELVIKKSNPMIYHTLRTEMFPLQPDEILVKLEKFGFTANNITYVALGKTYQYFDFFPANDSSLAKVNVWGVATVVQSNNQSIKVGERIYGYFPIAKYYCMKPTNISWATFYIERKHLPEDRLVYNQYFRQLGDKEYSTTQEEHMIIFRPLWGTAYFLNDFFKVNEYFGAQNLVISSASSKTAYSLALLLKGKTNMNVIGLTSPNNVEFVNSLGLYTSVYSYKDIEKLPSVPTVIVDVAGNPSLNERLSKILQDNLIKRVAVGMSHFDGKEPTLPHVSENSTKSKSITFFAPDWISKRKINSRHPVVLEKYGAWEELLRFAKEHVKLSIFNGQKPTEKVYFDMLSGNADPQNNFILSLWDPESKL